MKIKKLNESGYKLTIKKDDKTFNDYCYDYRKESAVAQMKAKYGDDIEVLDVVQHNRINEGIEVATIADYITDHYKFETIDDKYSCINSIRDSFKDEKTISKEELEQFIGSHNGKDKESKSINESVTHDEAPERFVKKLDESMKDYRFEVSCNDGPTKVVRLIWDEKDVEGAKEWAKKYYAQEHTTYADDRHNKWIIEESLNEDLSPREGDRVQMDFYAKDNNGATGTCTGRIGELCFIEWDDGTKSKEIKGYLKVIERPNMNEASYGGAFDVADDQIFTREDIDNLAEEVLNHINETYDYKFDISAAYIDGNELEVGVENDELGEYITTLKIDMRKVKEPWHLKRAYAFEVASDLINQISTSLNNLGESLTESATEDAKPIETGAALGMATVLSDLIKDEYEAIDGYNTAIATAEAEGFGDMVKVLTDIQAEENIHIGQLQELMKMVDPNASKIADGTVEAEELLSNPSVNDDDDFDFEDIDESFDVSEDDIADEDVDAAIKAVEEAMKESDKEEIDLTNANFDLDDDDEVIVESTEPWEDIYNSFKDIEVQLNGDGEAITATIDRIYNDNKGNPDFEKAYKKWAANE